MIWRQFVTRLSHLDRDFIPINRKIALRDMRWRWSIRSRRVALLPREDNFTQCLLHVAATSKRATQPQEYNIEQDVKKSNNMLPHSCLSTPLEDLLA
jgi:hypothetical protein